MSALAASILGIVIACACFGLGYVWRCMEVNPLIAELGELREQMRRITLSQIAKCKARSEASRKGWSKRTEKGAE
jgi:hypothetical protein